MDNLEIKMQKMYIEKIKTFHEGKNFKYYILTMGCQQNENDSEKLVGMIENMGYEETEEISKADLVVLNTCCIRESAEEKVFGKIGEVKGLKANNENLVLAVGGCMMQQEHIQKKLAKSYPYVDLIFGTHTLHKFPEDLSKVVIERQVITDLEPDGKTYEDIPIKRNNTMKANVSIMYGCDNFCTYCIVPYVRGKEKSRKEEDILAEVKDLAKKGYKEITLLGTNVNSYNSGGNLGCSFAELLRKINSISGIERIRFLSPHPKDFSDELIQAIKECKKVCKTIHLPLQSGSNYILDEMNRKYTREDFLLIVEKMKDEIPDIRFTTDIIVGFPGEEEEDFYDTLDVIAKVNFVQVFMFIFSPRKGTEAEKMKKQVPDDMAHSRFNVLKTFVDTLVEKDNITLVNTVQKVLVEGVSKTSDEMLMGRTDSCKMVIFEGDESLIGEIVDIHIDSAHRYHLKGTVLEKSVAKKRK